MKGSEVLSKESQESAGVAGKASEAKVPAPSVAGPASAASSSSGSGNAAEQGAAPEPKNSPEEVPSKESAPEDRGDLVSAFLPDESATTASQAKPTFKEVYLGCDFVMPGIALKKFAMILADHAATASSYMAILGGNTMTMYKKERSCAKSMVMGDAIGDTGFFWQCARKQLRSNGCAAICIFDTFSGEVTKVGAPENNGNKICTGMHGFWSFWFVTLVESSLGSRIFTFIYIYIQYIYSGCFLR